MELLRNRVVAVLAAAAIALTVAACGDDDDADQIRDQVESSVNELKQEGEDLRKEIQEGGSREEIQKQVDEFKKKARDQGDDIRKEAEELQKELEEKAP